MLKDSFFKNPYHKVCTLSVFLIGESDLKNTGYSAYRLIQDGGLSGFVV